MFKVLVNYVCNLYQNKKYVMKNLLTFCLLLFTLMNVKAQQVYENSYLSMNIPNGWEVQNVDVAGANMEMLYFYNSGDDIYNLGMVIGIEQLQDPNYVLQTQMDLKSNLMFENATFGSIHKSSFMGKPAQSVDFETIIDNVSFKGAAYAFNEGGCSIISIGCYKVGVNSNLPQIWRSIRWKQYKKDVDKYKNLREEIQAFADAVTKLWQQTPLINNGEQAVSIALEEGSDCIVYTYRLVDFSKSQFTDEQLTSIQEECRTNMIPILKTLASQTELIKKCMDEEYIFKYTYQDKNGEFLFSIKLIPDDYK